MDFKIIFFISLFIFSGHAAELKHPFQIRDYVKKFKKDDLVDNLRKFLNAAGHSRVIGSEGHLKVREYLHQFLTENNSKDEKLNIQEFNPNIEKGIDLYRNDFKEQIEGKFPADSEMFKKWNNFTNNMGQLLTQYKNVKGKNFIWTKKGQGSSAKKLILIAHYDTISHDKNTLLVDFAAPMPGADYNGSGVAVALSLIQILHNTTLQEDIEIVFLDYQGLGVLGALEYAQSIQNEKNNLLGIINLEMLGHDSKIFDKKNKLGNMSLYLRDKSVDEVGYFEDMKLVNKYQQLKNRCEGNITFEVKANHFKNSDHVRFWDLKVPTITFSQNWEEDFNEKGYQTKNDFAETLNFNTYYQAWRLISCFVLSMANNTK